MGAAIPQTDLFRNADQFELFEAGAHVFDAGESGELMYAVKEGEVDLVVAGVPVETVGPGGVFGEMAIIDHDVRSATAVAKTPCKLVPIDERRFNFLVHQHPYFAIHMCRVLTHRLRRMNQA